MIFMSWESEKEENSNSIIVSAPLSCCFKLYYSILELNATVLCRYFAKIKQYHRVQVVLYSRD